MPANLPPEYFTVEKRYKAAETIQEKIETLEELISTIPKHKGTDHLRADLRKRLSKYKASAEKRMKTSGAPASAFHIDSEGAGQVLALGAANAGKSSLVAALTNADPEIAPYPFSTWTPMPGMMTYENVQIQLVDTPPLNREFLEPEFMDLVRRCDMILLMVDLLADPMEQLEETIATLEQHRVVPLRLKDQYGGRRINYIPILVLANKNDDETTDENFEIFCGFLDDEWPLLPISTTTGRNLDKLARQVYDTLEIIRVYSKAPGKEADLSSPFVLEKGTTVEEFARKVHLDFYKNLKAAHVWGSADFDGQMVSRDYVLHDEDVVELKM